MTRVLVMALFAAVVLVMNCAVMAQQCLEGTNAGNCSLSTRNNETIPDAQVITTHAPSAMTLPKSMNMLAEDQMDLSPPSNPLTHSEELRGRALNFTMNENNAENILSSNNTSKDHFGDLSDVSISDEDDAEDHEMVSGKILAEKNITKHPLGLCEKGGLTYENGEKLENGCDSICTCTNGKMDCTDRCSGPYFRKGKKIEDPLCRAKEVEDPCCSILICSADTETEPLEMCSYNNKTYNRGETFRKGCSEVCLCDIAGKASCKPYQCPPVNKTSDRCVEVQDPNDSCCKKVLCDVTLQDHDLDKVEAKLSFARFVNLSTVELGFETGDNVMFIEASTDQKKWNTYSVREGKYVQVMEGTRFVKLENSNSVLPLEPMKTGDGDSCNYAGKVFKLGEEYNDNCTSLCVCKESGMKCLKLECPTYFGVDVLDPNCIEWETIPPDFVPSPPHCCPEELRCKSNGSCSYEGQTYQNWQQLPINVTGCEKRCYCEMGNVECQNTCLPVTAYPPPTLSCPPHQAMVDHLADDDCCMGWVCNPQANSGRNATNHSTTDLPLLGPLAPSKNFGPLLIYTNQDQQNHSHKSSNLSDNENPFYHNAKNKNPKTKPAKANEVMFVTPPSPHIDNYIPNQEASSSKKPQINKVPQIQVHGNGNPDELLQFINQHPEISNYPSGSVLEIHNVPMNQRPAPPPPPFINQNTGTHPFMGGHVDALPPGITLEQILQEIHKHSGNENHVLVAPNHFNSNGPFLVAPQSPILHNKFNASYQQGGFPGGFPNIPGFPHPAQDEISVHTLEAIDPHTVRLAFMVPPVLIGLHGRVEVRYTAHDNMDTNSWQLQVFAPPNDLIATPQLEFDLLDLKPDTEYRIKITITLRDVHDTRSSRVYKIRTLKEAATTLPPMIPIEPDLAITDINATWVTVVWRKFTDYELQFIDGVQLRFKETDGKIYDATPLIHRSVITYTLENLKANAKYEIGIFFIPFPGQVTELHAEHMLFFTTANEVDTYGFNVSLEIGHIKSTSVEITWEGVPYPEDKYVNIYRAIYQSDSGKEDQSTFKIAKRDSAAKSVIMDLKPGTRYRLWLEVYLTNGKIKTSNVQDFITKPRTTAVLGASSQQGEHREQKGDYYGPLVIVAILASIAIMSTLILLLILVRRHNQNKAAITPPTRVSQSAYDNPTYKVEIQQETMGL